MRKLLGAEFTGLTGLYQPPADSVIYLIKACRHLSGCRRVHGGVLEKLMGHLMWKFLLRRPCCGAMDSLYRFSRKHRNGVGQWCARARQELRFAAGLLPLAFADLARPILLFFVGYGCEWRGTGWPGG